jgi:hypothetical protein
VIGADHLVITESALDVVEGSPAKAHAEEPAAKERAEEPAPMGSAPAKASTETDPEGEAEPTTEAATTDAATTEAGGEVE